MGRNAAFDDLDATPREKRLSRIAADIWGIRPVRYDDDGDAYPLIYLENPESDRDEKLYEGRLGRIGIYGSCDYPDVSIKGGWWTPTIAADGKPVMRGGKFRHVEAVGLIYEDCDSMYDDHLPNALLKALDFEENGTPRERPHKLGAGPMIDLEEWRSRYTHFF